ncbi:hypothetical protein MKW98_031438, partial [Papaver atlanticum]
SQTVSKSQVFSRKSLTKSGFLTILSMEEAANNGISNLPDSLEALHINMEEAAKDMI